MAARCAARNIDSNLPVLQPHLIAILRPIELQVEWLFGRDGSLTARDSDDRWISGCSLPLLAAREMLKRLDVRGAVACFLAPTHAAQLRAALAQLRQEQAIVAIVPEAGDLRVMLGCENFRTEIESHRLWFITTGDWEQQLADLFANEPGLAPPAQFIRLPVTDRQLADLMIPRAQNVFSQVIQRRNETLRQVIGLSWNPPPVPRLCVVAPTQFRLWNDVGAVLVGAAREAGEWTLFDADDPACSSPLGLAGVARQCSALLTANTARCDLPGIVPDQMPWITWAAARIPDVVKTAPRDQLVVLNSHWQRLALERGWPESRIRIGGWPALVAGATHRLSGPTTIVVDTTVIEQPEQVKEFSSHSLLWDGIRDELLRDPCALGNDPEAYLALRMKRLDLAADGPARALFLSQLILPAWQQGLARLLIGAEIPIRIYGKNWPEIDEFASHTAGAVESSEHLQQILQQTRALVQCWLTPAHPAEAAGVPVVATLGRARDQILLATRASAETTTNTGPAFDGNLLQKILLQTRD